MHHAISGLCCSGFLFGRLLWQLHSQMNSTNSSLKLPASLSLPHVHLHAARHAYPELIPAYKIMAFDCSQTSTTGCSESSTNIPRTRVGKTVTLVLASYFYSCIQSCFILHRLECLRLTLTCLLHHFVHEVVVEPSTFLHTCHSLLQHHCSVLLL